MVAEAVAGRCAEERIDWDKMAFTPGARAYGRVGPDTDDDFTGAVNAMGMLIEPFRYYGLAFEVKNPEQQARLGFLAEALCINCYPTDTTVRDAATPLFDFVWLASKKTFDAETPPIKYDKVGSDLDEPHHRVLVLNWCQQGRNFSHILKSCDASWVRNAPCRNIDCVTIQGVWTILHAIMTDAMRRDMMHHVHARRSSVFLNKGRPN